MCKCEVSEYSVSRIALFMLSVFTWAWKALSVICANSSRSHVGGWVACSRCWDSAWVVTVFITSLWSVIRVNIATYQMKTFAKQLGVLFFFLALRQTSWTWDLLVPGAWATDLSTPEHKKKKPMSLFWCWRSILIFKSRIHLIHSTAVYSSGSLTYRNWKASSITISFLIHAKLQPYFPIHVYFFFFIRFLFQKGTLFLFAVCVTHQR